jgi:hypothetical protein
LYHYCAPEVFLKILQSRTLWASDILRMNDLREIEYAFADILSPLVSERENGHSKYFLRSLAPSDQIRNIWGTGNCTHIACLSSTSELPSQWKTYAKCAGYAIGFNRAALQTWCNACGVAGSGVTLFPVIYDASLQTKLIREFLDREKQLEMRRCADLSATMPVRDEARVYLAILAMALKDPQHSAEKEWRILIIQRNDRDRFNRLTREDGVCYFELPLIAPELVTHIVCGPQCTTGTAELRSQLTDVGLGAVEIRRAECECEET